MFSIKVEEAFKISTNKGITIIGITSGLIKLGDYLVDANNYSDRYKVIGIEMIHFADLEKNLSHNPAILIEQGDYEPLEFKGKTLKLE